MSELSKTETQQGETKVKDSTITTPQATIENTKSIQATVASDTTYHRCSFICSIRRKPNMTAIPGQDPNERIYKIGASLDKRNGGNLKGISGDLEALIMPEIVGFNPNAPEFRKAVDEYWSSISKIVPPDEEFLQEYEKGVKIKLEFNVIGSIRKNKFNETLRVVDKLELLNTWLVTKIGEDDAKPIATLEYDSVADFLLLNYAIRYSRVANSFADIHKSLKITFYIYEKAVAVKQSLSNIDLRNKATQLYTIVANDERKLDAILLAFKEKLENYPDIVDRQIALDTLVFKNIENTKQFVALAEDTSWETKYLINLSLSHNRLSSKPNSTAIYYMDKMIGIDMDEAIRFLNGVEGQEIKHNLTQQSKI